MWTEASSVVAGGPSSDLPVLSMSAPCHTWETRQGAMARSSTRHLRCQAAGAASPRGYATGSFSRAVDPNSQNPQSRMRPVGRACWRHCHYLTFGKNDLSATKHGAAEVGNEGIRQDRWVDAEVGCSSE